MKISRECECGPKRLKHWNLSPWSRCAKRGKPIPSNRRPQVPMLPATVEGVELTELHVDDYKKLLADAEPVRAQMAKEGRL